MSEGAANGCAKAQQGVANFYLTGYGSHGRNLRGAVEWLQKAARNEVPSAEYKLARSLETGRGVSKHFEKALEWYYRAAKNGHRPAQAKMRYFHMKGIC